MLSGAAHIFYAPTVCTSIYNIHKVVHICNLLMWLVPCTIARS